MPCCRRQSYIVNPAEKKDFSFKVFITFLVAVLFAFLVIYALILTLKKDQNNNENKENEEPIFENQNLEAALGKFDNNDENEQLYTTKAENNEEFTETPTKIENSSEFFDETDSTTTEIENETFKLSTNKSTTTSTKVDKEENLISIAENYIIDIESTLAATKIATDKAIIIEEICHSPDCKKTAIDIMKNIDFSIDPCEDFYQFSCGNDVRTSKFDGYFGVLFEEIKIKNSNGSFAKFFQSCSAYFGNLYGSFDIIKQVLEINIPSENLTSLLGFLLLRQATPLFEIIEGKNGEIQILPPGSYATDILENWSLKSHLKKYCSTSQNFDDYKQCQSKKLHKMSQNLNSFKNLENPIEDFLQNTVKHQISTIDIQEALFRKSCQKIDILQLSKIYPVINWQELFKIIAMNPSKPICMYFKNDYFDPILSNLNAKISKNESEILNSIKNYFQLQLYENLMPNRDDKFCMKQTIELMPEIAEKILQQNVDVDELKLFEVYFEEVKDKFDWLIDVAKLKEDDKSLFKNKLKLLKVDFNKVAKADRAINFTSDDDYLTKLLMLLIENRRMLHKEKFTILKKVDLVDDRIVIPYSFIYKTTIRKRRQDFSIKFHISRAIVRYLSQIAQNEKNIFYQQFQKSLNQNLENKLDARSRELSKLIPASTLERTADNLALEIAFNFPKNDTIGKKLPWISKEFTDEKQFFLVIGQDICESSPPQSQFRIIEETETLPAKFRIDSMLTNSRNFAKSFDCAEGSRMNPANEKIEFDRFEFDDEYEYEYRQN